MLARRLRPQELGMRGQLSGAGRLWGGAYGLAQGGGLYRRGLPTPLYRFSA